MKDWIKFTEKHQLEPFWSSDEVLEIIKYYKPKKIKKLMDYLEEKRLKSSFDRFIKGLKDVIEDSQVFIEEPLNLHIITNLDSLKSFLFGWYLINSNKFKPHKEELLNITLGINHNTILEKLIKLNNNQENPIKEELFIDFATFSQNINYTLKTLLNKYTKSIPNKKL